MKKLFTLLAFVITIIAFAQAPEGFNYQATVRNNSGQLLLNQIVLVKFKIIQNPDPGTIVYSENQTANTDDLGHINLVVGQGTATTGSFSSINWGMGTYYLGIELNTGSGYVAMGTTQLLSVPYALYAQNAGTASGGGNFTHYIGEQFGGGVIFHLWKDNVGVEHGLLVATTDQSTTAVWSNVNSTLIGPTAQSSWDGLSNSNAIVAQAGHTTSASAKCLNLVSGGQSDWYLPSIDELSLLWHNRFNVNKTLSTIGDATVLPIAAPYWSSTENNASSAWMFYFRNGAAYDVSKLDTNYVRAVRAF